MKWVVTGADGFLGWHLRCRLLAQFPELHLVPLRREDYCDPATLIRAVTDADAVVHLAAVNSHLPAVEAANAEITDLLLAALRQSEATPHIVVANSTHSETDSPYGRAKRKVVDSLRGWATAAGSTLSDVVLPGIFGEGGRPNYNSVTATICDAVVVGKAAQLNSDAQIELIHAQDACLVLIESALKRPDHVRPTGAETSVGELHRSISRLHSIYSRSGEIPSLENEFTTRLFNQLRFRMFEDRETLPLRAHHDQRGTYAEVVRSSDPCQVSFSTTQPGRTRGEHFHFAKIERFAVVGGEGRIELRRLFDDHVHEIHCSGRSPVLIDIPTLFTHNLSNVGTSELVTLFWTNEHFDPMNADTWPEPVHRSGLR